MLLSAGPDVLINILERVAVADVLAVGAVCRVLRDLTSADDFWRGLAERKWGARVLQLRPQRGDRRSCDAGGPGSGGTWKAYAVGRMNLRTIRPSPLELVQERFPDPWMHITCCVLCSRTSGSGTIRAAVSRFFEALPTPTAVLDAGDGQITSLLRPLGLQPVRLRAVRAVAHDFLATDWADPSAFHGCGKFVADSWRIFCRGDLSGAGVEDRNLRGYVAWGKRTSGSAFDGADATYPGSGGASAGSEGAARARARGTAQESARGQRRARREAAARAVAQADGGRRPSTRRAAAAAVAAGGGLQTAAPAEAAEAVAADTAGHGCGAGGTGPAAKRRRTAGGDQAGGSRAGAEGAKATGAGSGRPCGGSGSGATVKAAAASAAGDASGRRDQGRPGRGGSGNKGGAPDVKSRAPRLMGTRGGGHSQLGGMQGRTVAAR